MKLRVALHIAGVVNLSIAAAMIFPLLVSLFYGEPDAMAFLISIAVAAGVGGVLYFVFRGHSMEVSHREGFIVVAVSWLSAALLSSLPYILSGALPSTLDCLFEATSGITTTGATIINDIDSLPHGILFWRSFTHWIGGMGIVLLSLAILPLLGIGGMQLYKAEASTISGDKFVPRIREMAKIIFIVYVVISFIMLVFLVISGLSIYDALIHTLGGISTAGFSNKNLSVGYFNNVYSEIVIMAMMILGGTNFALHYGFFKKGLGVYTRNEEFRFFLTIIAVSTLAIAISLTGNHYMGFFESLRYASFQAVSITTTTGYTSADYGQWPYFSQLLLFSLMFVGGSVGSTTGSIKAVRVLLLLKLVYKEVYRLIHPHAVVPVKLGGKVVSPEIMKSVVGFTFLFLLVFMASSLLLSLMGLDIITSVGSTAGTLGNVGPGLGLTGPASNYSVLPDGAKWVLILNMLLGRLEIYTLLILLFPAFWRG